MAYVSGILGVEIFFCLSGFLIGGILLDMEGVERKGHMIAVFMIRRWMRTLPAYYIVLSVYYLFPALDREPRERVWSYALLAQNLVSPMPHANWFAVTWSLTIEEWSYLLVPLVAFLAFRGQSVLKALMLFIVAAFVTRLCVHPSNWDAELRKTVYTRLDAIAYGAVAVAFCRRYGSAWARYTAFAGVPLLALCLWFAHRYWYVTDQFADMFFFPVLLLSIASLLPLALDIHPPVLVMRAVQFRGAD